MVPVDESNLKLHRRRKNGSKRKGGEKKSEAGHGRTHTSDPSSQVLEAYGPPKKAHGLITQRKAEEKKGTQLRGKKMDEPGGWIVERWMPIANPTKSKNLREVGEQEYTGKDGLVRSEVKPTWKADLQNDSLA